MKYIVIRGNSLHYQRQFPSDLQHLTGKAMYRRLQLDIGATQQQVTLASNTLNQEFEQRLSIARQAMNSSSDSDTIAAQAKMIDILNLQSANNHLTLNDLWQEYTSSKQLAGRALQIANIDWQRFIRICGNLIADDLADTSRRINAAIKAQTELRLLNVKPSTVKREISLVSAALRQGAKKHQLQWHINPIDIANHVRHDRDALSLIETQQLLDALGNDTSCTDVDAILLMSLIGGITPSEVARLTPEEIHLNTNQPFLRIPSKSKDTFRIAPIPIKATFLRHSIDGAINLANMSKGYISRSNTERLRAITGNTFATLAHVKETYKKYTADIDTSQHEMTNLFNEISDSFSILIENVQEKK